MKFGIHAGGEFETVTPAELRHELASTEQRLRTDLRGIKARRLPGGLTGLVTAAGIAIGGDSGDAGGRQVGPSQGNMWMIRHISVNGLAAGVTPDILNLNIYGAGLSGFNWWQFNGNNFAFTFGMFELWLEPGEYLGFASQGAVTAAVGSTIRIGGHLLQVPMEMAAKLLGGN
jgi:hypothetical protein